MVPVNSAPDELFRYRETFSGSYESARLKEDMKAAERQLSKDKKVRALTSNATERAVHRPGMLLQHINLLV